LLERAEVARRADDLDAAIAGYRAALAAEPALVAAHRGLQDALLAAGREEDARAEYAALAERTGAPWALVLHGRVLFDPAREEELSREALARGGDERDALVALGSALRRQLRFDEAADVLARAVDLAAGDAEAHVAYAWCAIQAGRGDAVRARYQRAAGAAPDDPLPHRVLAMLAGEEHDEDARRAHIAAFVERAPDGSAVRRARVALAGRGDDPAATLAAIRALAEHPERTARDLAMAAYELARGWGEDDPRVAEWLEEAHFLAPTDPRPLAMRAFLRVRDRDLLDVDDVIAEALRRDPTEVRALSAAAELARMRKEPGEAVERYQLALRADDEPWLRRELAGLLSREGRLAEAAVLLAAEPGLATRDLASAQERDDVLAGEVLALCRLGRQGEALVRAGGRSEDPACSPRLLAAVADAHALGGDLDDALALLDRAARRAEGPDGDPELRGEIVAQRVRDLLRAGRRDEAFAALRELGRGAADVPEGYPLSYLVGMLRFRPEEAELALLDEWPRAAVGGDDTCLSDACRALLAWRGVEPDAATSRALAEMPGHLSTALRVLRDAGLDPVPFRIEKRALRDLLRQRQIVLVTTVVVRESEIAGHAGLAVGFDDRLGIVHVEDVSLRGVGFLTDGQLEGECGIVLQNPRGPDLRAQLPGVSYWTACCDAEELLSAGDAAGALAAVERAEREDPGDQMGLLLKAKALGALDRPEDRMDCLRRASALEHADVYAHLSYGHAAVNAEDGEAARVALRRATRLVGDPLPVRRLELQLAALETADRETVRAAAESVLELDENSASALYWRGYAYLWDDRFGAASSDLAQSLALSESSMGWWYLSVARENLGDVAGSIAAMERYRGLLVRWEAEEGLAEVDERIANLRAREVKGITTASQ
jgi:tetratricopeptide (TPR) repeat protein